MLLGTYRLTRVEAGEWNMFFRDHKKIKGPVLVDTLRKLDHPVLEIKDPKTGEVKESIKMDIPLWVSDRTQQARSTKKKLFDVASVVHHTNLVNDLKSSLENLNEA